MIGAPGTAVGLEELRAAARVLEGVAVRTPLVEVAALSALAGVPVLLKCEQLQPVGAFKIRGAYNAVARVAAEGRAAGVGASLPARARALTFNSFTILKT